MFQVTNLSVNDAKNYQEQRRTCDTLHKYQLKQLHAAHNSYNLFLV